MRQILNPQSKSIITRHFYLSNIQDTHSSLTLIVLIRSPQVTDDDQDRRVGVVQDEAMQEVQRQWLLPLRYEVLVHPLVPWCWGREEATGPAATSLGPSSGTTTLDGQGGLFQPSHRVREGC